MKLTVPCSVPNEVNLTSIVMELELELVNSFLCVSEKVHYCVEECQCGQNGKKRYCNNWSSSTNKSAPHTAYRFQMEF